MALDLITSYYYISLTDAAKKICTTTTLFGKYEYNSLPMGVFIAPYIFQDQMSAIMYDLEFVRVYTNHFLTITSRSFKEHLSNVEEVMKRLQLSGIKCKIEKCKFLVPKVEYLGYIIK